MPTFALPDRLVFRRNKTLFVQSFDPGSGRLSGEPRALVEAGLAAGFMASPSSSAAGNGVLAFVPLIDHELGARLVRPRTAFKASRSRCPPGSTPMSGFPPTGRAPPRPLRRRTIRSARGCDIWLVDLARKSGSRVTFDAGFEFAPVWSPDGRSIYYNCNKTGDYLIYRRYPPKARARRPPSPSRGGCRKQPNDVTPDGRPIVFEAQEASTGNDLWVLDASGGKAAGRVPGHSVQ